MWSASKVQAIVKAMSTTSEASQILVALNGGDRSHVDRLIELVYGELRRLASTYVVRRGPREPLQATELVHEAFLKLVHSDQRDWLGRSHFYAVAATAMRQILVDQARKRLQTKRGGGDIQFPLTDDIALSMDRDADVLALDEALSKLSELRPERARLVEFRFFGGMTMTEIAEAVGLPKRSLEREWTITRAWLRRQLSPSNTSIH